MFKTKFDSVVSIAEGLHQQGRVQKISFAPILLYLANIHHLEDSDIIECYTEGGNDAGVDAVYIDRDSDKYPSVYLIQSKMSTSIRKGRNPFKKSGLDKIQLFFNFLKNDITPLEKASNPKLAEKIKEIRRIQERTSVKFTIVLVSNGSPPNESEIIATKEAFTKMQVSIENFHLKELFENCIGNPVLNDERVFHAIPNSVVKIDRAPVSGAYGLLSAIELHKFLKSRSDHRAIERGIFDLNVRGFLGLGGDINQEILRSATSSKNATFWAKNNGITIVSKGGAVDLNAIKPVITLNEARVVNGAQTCSSIFQAINDLGKSFKGIENLAIPFRVFFTDDEGLIEDISVATNSQNRINLRDLKANDELQKTISVELTRHSIFYQRKRGANPAIGFDGILDALRAGQIILAYDFGEPHRSKRDSNQIFGTLYKRLFTGCDIEKLVDGFNVLRIIENVSMNKNFIESVLEGIDVDSSFISYASFHILYAYGKLGKTEEGAAPDEKQITEAIKIIGQVLASKRRISFYSFFRDSSSVRIIEEKIQQPSLFD